MKKNKIIVGVLSLLLLAALVAGAIIYHKVYRTYEGEKVRLYIPAGATAESVRDSLVTHLGDYGDDVYRLWNLRKSLPERAHGSYVVSPGDNVLDFSRRLRYGSQSPVRVTFNNIRTLDALARRVAAKMEWGDEAFIAACDSLLPAKGFKKSEFPAAFLPDTSEFFWTTPASEVVRKLSDIREGFWNDERRAKASRLGLRPVEVAVLASIVEEETAKADERGTVARLYLNRLGRGMLLQADPTVKFAVGDFSLRRILSKHLAVDSPYNTYKYQGLPPGPIRIVERATIDAVLDAQPHPYIYMCAKEDFSGYHNFAVDYSRHMENARRYQRELNRRNIR